LRSVAGAGAIALLGAQTIVLLSAQDSAQFRDPAAQDLFRYARLAVGSGEGSVVKLRTLQFKGKSKVDPGSGVLIDCKVDIKILLPDHVLRVDTAPFGQKFSGYAGKTLLTGIQEGDKTSVPPDNLKPAILKAERVRLAQLMLGAATYISADVSMIFQSIGGATEMIDPRVSARTAAKVDSSRPEPLSLDVGGDDGFKVRFVVDGKTRVPAKLEYAGADNKTVTMAFTDRRAVGGLQMPYRITTTGGARVIDDLIFDEILINPEIGKGDFKR
jgi:hypothetical protein